mgnify:FL=1
MAVVRASTDLTVSLYDRHEGQSYEFVLAEDETLVLQGRRRDDTLELRHVRAGYLSVVLGDPRRWWNFGRSWRLG